MFHQSCEEEKDFLILIYMEMELLRCNQMFQKMN